MNMSLINRLFWADTLNSLPLVKEARIEAKRYLELDIISLEVYNIVIGYLNVKEEEIKNGNDTK